MGRQIFTNNAKSTLSGTLPQGGVTLVCASGQGSRFPSPTGGDFFYLTVYTKDVYTNEQDIEVVKVTARTGDVMTVERDIESLTGSAGGYAYNGSTTTVFLELRWTAGSVANMAQTSDISNVNNTSDLNKPISTATQTALNGKATAAQGAKADSALQAAAIGVSIQAYDLDTAKTDVKQTWTGVQRTNELSDADASFDLDAGYLDFTCIPTAGVVLTFVNIPATPLVQKGTVLFINTAQYAVAAHDDTKISAADLTKISATGVYELFYRTSNGACYVVASGKLA